jgi:hypothetical protein
MDLIFSIGFLLLTMVLAASYVALGYVLVLTPGMLWRRFRPHVGDDPVLHRSWSLNFKKKVCLFLIAVTISFCFLGYKRNRAEWMNEDNAHYDAKQYFVVGQVVFGMRLLLTTFLHPDNPVLWPLNRLQEWIFLVGSKRLPEGDGERRRWMNKWFAYPYSRKHLDPCGTSDCALEQDLLFHRVGGYKKMNTSITTGTSHACSSTSGRDA